MFEEMSGKKLLAVFLGAALAAVMFRFVGPMVTPLEASLIGMTKGVTGAK